MAYEQKDNSGSLFGNEKRESEKHPHAKGTAMIDGREYWVDAWTNTAANGKRYQSLKFKLKDQQSAPAGGGYRDTTPPPADDLDDEIPFD
jgi:hypothetical protein